MIKTKTLLLTCTLLSTLMLNRLAASAQPPTTEVASEMNQENSPTGLQELHTLSQWVLTKKYESLQAWVSQNTALAAQLLNELIVDQYTSSWLALPPQYPGGTELIKILVNQLQVDPECLALAADALERKCPTASWAGEVSTLLGLKNYFDKMFVDDLFNTGPDVSGISYEQNISTQRGSLQADIYHGMNGNVYEQRWEYLQSALKRAKQIQASDLEFLIQIGMIDILSIKDDFVDMRMKKTPEEKQALIDTLFTSLNHDKRAARRPELQFALRLLQHRLGQLSEVDMNKQVQHSLEQIKNSYQKEYYLMAYADYLTQIEIKTDRRYLDLFNASNHFKEALMQRLVAYDSAEVNSKLLKQFQLSPESKEKTILAQIYVAQTDYQTLFDLYKNAQDNELKKRYLSLLLSLTRQEEFPVAYLEEIVPLALSEDAELRDIILSQAYNMKDPKIEAMIMNWAYSPYADLQTRALWKANQEQKKALLPRALELSHTDNDALLYAVLYLIKEVGSEQEIRVLETLLPHTDQKMESKILNTIARLKGVDSFLAELHQAYQNNDPRANQLYEELDFVLITEQVQPLALIQMLPDLPPDKQLDLLQDHRIQLSAEIKTPQAQHILLNLLNAKDPRVQMRVIDLLNEKESTPRVIQTLKQIATDNGSPEQLGALQKLAEFDIEALRLVLKTLPQKQNLFFKKDLISILKEHPDLIHSLSYFLSDPNPDIYRPALFAALKQNSPSLRQKLVPLLHRTTLGIRSKLSIIQQLTSSGEVIFLPELEKLLKLNSETELSLDESDYYFSPITHFTELEVASQIYPETEEQFLKMRAIQAIITLSPQPESVLKPYRKTPLLNSMIDYFLAHSQEVRNKIAGDGL